MATSRQASPAPSTSRFKPSFSSAPARSRSSASMKRGPRRARSTGDLSAVSTLSTCIATPCARRRRSARSRNGASLEHAQAEVLGQRQDVGQRDGLARMEQPEREAVRRHARLRRSSSYAERRRRRRRACSSSMSATRLAGVEARRDRPGGTSRASGAAARPSASPSLACSAARSRSFHEVAASARACSSSARSGAGAARRVELQRIERLGQRGIAADRRGGRRSPRRSRPARGWRRSARSRAASKRSRGANTRAVAKRPTVSRRANSAHAPPLLQLQDAQHMVVERVLVDLEQLVARIGLEDRQQRLAVVAVGGRSPERRSSVSTRPRSSGTSCTARVIGGRGEQPDQAVLAGDAAVGVEGLHDHAVHRRRCDGPASAGRSSTIRMLCGPRAKRGHRLAAADARPRTGGPRRGAGCPAPIPAPARSAGRPVGWHPRHSDSGDGRGR